MVENERKLAAVMFTDMVGYTALGQRNESLSLALVEEQRKLIRPTVARYNGREVKTIGDGFLVVFPNALDAVKSAYEIQRTIREFNVTIPEDRRLHLRIGVHLGDVVESDGDVSGDAVNVASRIESLAEDGGVCISRSVHDSIRGKFELPFVGLGAKPLKNVIHPIEVYSMEMPWTKVSSKEASSAFPTSRIAILPFASFSVDPNDGFLADGITDEIISAAAGISGLSVISRTSVVGYKGTTKKAEEIGRELKVGTILEGTFKKAGNRIRVTTQLIDVAQDKHLWAQNYDRALDDVFEVQSDVAKRVAEALRIKILTPEIERIDKRPTENTTAFTLYLKGRYLWNTRRLDDLRKATDCFAESVREDPGFALGYGGLADCALLFRNNWQLDTEENLEKARRHSTRALELDPHLGEIHATKGLVHSSEFDFVRAEAEFKRAIELKPSYATAHMWYHQVLLAELRWEEALEQIERTLELDPLSGAAYTNLGNYFFARRDLESCLDAYQRATELGVALARTFKALAYGKMKKFDEMKRENLLLREEGRKYFPRFDLGVDMSEAYLLGEKGRMKELLPELEQAYGEVGLSNYGVACCHFFLGQNDKGFEWLQKSFESKEFSLIGLKSDSDLDDVRSDARYIDLLKRLHLDS